MRARSRRTLLIAATAAVVVAASAARPSRCAVCERRLPARFWSYDGQPCCSEKCVDRLRPKCANCRGVMSDLYYESENKTYCSKRCFETTLPKCSICFDPVHDGYTITSHHYCARCVEENPTCFSCGLPAGHATKLKDGREVCGRCQRWSVHDPVQAQRHYDRARRFLEAWTSMKIETPPTLRLVDREEMKALADDLRKTDSPVPIRGLYSRQTLTRKRGFFGAWKKSAPTSKEYIYIMDHLRDEVFRVAAVHELTHDLIHERFPRLEDAPLWVHEGLCQQAAAEYCRRRNLTDALRLIDECEDPDYGDGYRYMKRVAGTRGWPALKQWMETVDVKKLPKTAPKG